MVGNLQPERYGNGHPNIVPYSDFQCNDGFIAIAVGNDNQFARLAQCLGNPEWAENDLYRTNSDRVINRNDIEQKITSVLLTKSVKNWLVLFEAQGIPCSKINSVSEALESTQAKVNKMVLAQDHPTVGKFRTLGIPYSFSQTPAKISVAPPLLGADTDDILTKIIGLETKEIEKLRNDGVL